MYTYQYHYLSMHVYVYDICVEYVNVHTLCIEKSKLSKTYVQLSQPSLALRVVIASTNVPGDLSRHLHRDFAAWLVADLRGQGQQDWRHPPALKTGT